jgi:hypothetical protein
MLEHRPLEKLIDTFLAMMEGRGVGRVTLRGSVVLLSSIASLTFLGKAGYTEKVNEEAAHLVAGRRLDRSIKLL